MRNGGWMTSLSCASPSSGTSRPISGKSAKLMRRSCATSGQTETLLDRGKVCLATLLEVHQTLDHIAEKRPLFAVCLVVGKRLHDRDAATAAGQEHRPARLVALVHDLARVDLQLGQRDDILGELGGSHDSSALYWSVKGCI